MPDTDIIDLPDKDKNKVTIGGLIINLKRHITKNDNMMCFLDVEDKTKKISIVVFPDTYEKIAENIREDGVVIITGKLEVKEYLQESASEDGEVEVIYEKQIIAKSIKILN